MKLSPTVIVIGSYEMKLNGYRQKNVPNVGRKQLEAALSQNNKFYMYSSYEKYDKRLLSKGDAFLTSFIYISHRQGFMRQAILGFSV